MTSDKPSTRVIWRLPVRHWVLTLPPPLHYLVAHDATLSGAVSTA
jgi:hypothetical protein